jgi:hypothetical protein
MVWLEGGIGDRADELIDDYTKLCSLLMANVHGLNPANARTS